MTAYDSEYMRKKAMFRDEIQAAVGELKDLRLPKNLSNFLQITLDDVDGLRRPSVRSLLSHKWIQEGLVGGPKEGRKRLNSKVRTVGAKRRTDNGVMICCRFAPDLR